MATPDYTYTLAAWTAVAGVAGAAYYFWPESNKRKQKITSSKQTIKKKLGVEEPVTGELRSTKEKAQKKKKRDRVNTGSADDVPQFQTTTEESSFDQEELNNKEFARQFQNAQSGTISVAQSKANSRPKSVKQSRAASSVLDSSTTGADGDDDRSAGDSPILGATKSPAPQSGDISDMLEPARAGPSVMRITESTKPIQPKKDKKPVQEEIKETKKQRQNRKKAEERKLAKEEDEKERRILMEKQLRTARQAEGRAAKDGSAFMAAKAPASSAWTEPPATSKPGNANGNNAPTDLGVPLLDTYEPAQNGTQEVSKLQPSNGNKSSSDWEVLPSEEEQLRLLSEDSEWKPVKAKKGKKEMKSSEASAAEIVQAPKKPAPVKSTGSFAALKDEAEDSTAIWEEKKGFTKTASPKKSANNVRISRTHEFSYVTEDGTTGLIISKEPSKEDEWEVS